MLKFFEDDTGMQIFTPVVLECSLEWSSILPKIVGELEGKKFTLVVDLGGASSFLRFDNSLRKFLHTPSEGKEGTFSVAIEITDTNGLTSRFDLRINYICPLINSVVKPLNSYKLRYDKNPPVPYIY